jgi:hypothetical protein
VSNKSWKPYCGGAKAKTTVQHKHKEKQPIEYKQIEHVESARSQELGSSRRSCIACSLIYSKKELKYWSESHVRRTAHVTCRSTIHSKLKNLASPTTLEDF